MKRLPVFTGVILALMLASFGGGELTKGLQGLFTFIA